MRPPRATPESTSSSPSSSRVTRGRLVTGTASWPAAAMSPSRAGDSSMPASAIRSSARHSSPARRMSSEIEGPLRESPTSVPRSWRRTPSVPTGVGAPVAIRTAVPGSSGAVADSPACTVPVTVHGGGPLVAQPSMAEASKLGRSLRACRGLARTRRSAAPTLIVSAGSRSPRPRASSRATDQGASVTVELGVPVMRWAATRGRGRPVAGLPHRRSARWPRRSP